MTINRIDMEDITTRVDELREERGDLQTAIDDAEETLNDAKDPTSGLAPEDVADAAEALTAAVAALDEWSNAEGDANAEELAELEALLDELRGYGGDHKHDGDWYPRELIADYDFQDYAMQLADDIGAIPDDAGWPNNCIDWERAARELAMDYSMVTFRGTDYYYRGN